MLRRTQVMTLQLLSPASHHEVFEESPQLSIAFGPFVMQQLKIQLRKFPLLIPQKDLTSLAEANWAYAIKDRTG
jgi:hypothetical protein